MKLLYEFRIELPGDSIDRDRLQWCRYVKVMSRLLNSINRLLVASVGFGRLEMTWLIIRLDYYSQFGDCYPNQKVVNHFKECL